MEYAYWCLDCGKEGSAFRATRGRKRQLCDTCAQNRERAAKRAYAASERGKQKNREATARWLQSTAGQEYLSNWDLDGSKSAARQRRFRATGKGHATWIRARCIKAGVPYARAVEVATAVGDGRASCYWCGCRAEHVDHVLPIAMAKLFGMGDLVDDYVAPMCARCHRAKSGRDRGDTRYMRNRLPTMPES